MRLLRRLALVIGPLNQAARELEEEEIEHDDMVAAAKGVEAPPPVSKRSRLAPPIYFLLRKRRSDDFRRAIVEAMPDAKVAALVSFRDKANAWFFVAAGAFLIAVKETWELHEGYEWSDLVFWGLVVLMLFAAAAHATGGVRRRRDPRAALLHRRGLTGGRPGLHCPGNDGPRTARSTETPVRRRCRRRRYRGRAY